MSKVQTLRNRLERQRGKRDQIAATITTVEEQVEQLNQSKRHHEQALEIIRVVGLQTQQQLQVQISDVTSLAMEAVFDDPYSLVVEFVERRKKTECDLWFERDGQRLDPLSATGGGAVDVAAFALRIASWSMQRPSSRPVIILDEPLRFLDTERQERASSMFKELSERMGLQFLIVTHEPTLARVADRTFNVTIDSKGVTTVKQNG